jgi:site-specific DNA-methyltransferase (adenine-specific)
MCEPYYSDANVTLYHGDCLKITDWLAADVLVTDPPYGTKRMAGNPRGGYGRRDLSFDGKTGFVIDNDETTDARDSALALWALKPALVFGSPRLPDPPGDWSDRLVWDKKRPGMNGGPWRYRHESIFVTAGFVRRDNEATSILTAWPDQSQHIHAKPLGLMTSLVDRAPAGVIADPFAGSGSTLVAAANLGRKCIGVELDERYCELVAKRLDQQCFDFGTGA